MQFYLTAQDAWQAMEEDCRKAEHSISVEQYVVKPDPVGCNFLKVLAERARAGVHVRLILDAIGSRRIRDTVELADLLAAGGEVRFYHRLWWIQFLSPSSWFPRNHSKTLTIDRRIAYLGGVCLAEYMKHWRDTHLRLTNALAQQIVQDFDALWAQLTGMSVVTAERAEEHDRKLRYVSRHSFDWQNPVYKEMLDEINRATDSVWLATPYFFPPRRLRRALWRAMARGVDVAVIISHQTDVPIADHVSRSYLPRFLRKGLPIFIYRANVLHAKYAVIDERWATIGSTNFDYVSLLFNREANIIARDNTVVAQLKQHFLQDKKHCTPATLDDWYGKPLHHRLIGVLGRAMKRWM